MLSRKTLILVVLSLGIVFLVTQMSHVAHSVDHHLPHSQAPKSTHSSQEKSRFVTSASDLAASKPNNRVESKNNRLSENNKPLAYVRDDPATRQPQEQLFPVKDTKSKNHDLARPSAHKDEKPVKSSTFGQKINHPNYVDPTMKAIHEEPTTKDSEVVHSTPKASQPSSSLQSNASDFQDLDMPEREEYFEETFVNNREMYDLHPLNSHPNITHPELHERPHYMDGYGGSIALNRQSVKVGHGIMSPFEHRAGSRIGHASARQLALVTHDVFHHLPKVDPLTFTRFKTCAVVGSAGLLLTREFGPEIDSHDAVFRFNLAPVRGFEKFVGNKTSIRLVNRKHLGFRESPQELVLQHVTTADVMKQFLEYRALHPGLFTYAMDMGFYRHVMHGKHKAAERPTNGFFGLHLAMMLCENVSIYGFLRNWKGWVQYHYFNPEEPNEQQLQRDTSGEMPMIESMLKANPHMKIVHPCLLNSDCENCSPGAMCDLKKQAPFPVPQPGYCKSSENSQCFAKCPSGTICKGGTGPKSVCPDEVVLMSDFRCVESHSTFANILYKST